MERIEYFSNEFRTMLEENVTEKRGGREGLRVFGRVPSLPDLIGGSLGRVVMRLIRALMKSMVRPGVGYRMIRCERTMINAVSHRHSIILTRATISLGDFFLSPPFFTNIYDEYFLNTEWWVVHNSIDSDRYLNNILICKFSTLLLLLLFTNCRNVERDVNF